MKREQFRKQIKELAEEIKRQNLYGFVFLVNDDEAAYLSCDAERLNSGYMAIDCLMTVLNSSASKGDSIGNIVNQGLKDLVKEVGDAIEGLKS